MQENIANSNGIHARISAAICLTFKFAAIFITWKTDVTLDKTYSTIDGKSNVVDQKI